LVGALNWLYDLGNAILSVERVAEEGTIDTQQRDV
jgi:hypothetical protein